VQDLSETEYRSTAMFLKSQNRATSRGRAEYTDNKVIH
jgi:hypothetical protein